MMGISSYGIVFMAGLVSFASPCVLPLIPSYLSFIAGTSYKELQAGEISLRQVFLRTLGFVGGFSTVFISLGLVLSSTFILMGGGNQILQQISGGIVIILGLSIFTDKLSFLQREWKIHPQRKPTSILGSYLVGMAFGAGWSPCVGPVLGGVLLWASQTRELGKSAFLLLLYSIGLGLPFLISSLFVKSLLEKIKKFQAFLPALRLISGILLIGIGVSIFLGRFQNLTQWITQLGLSLQSLQQQNPRATQIMALFTLSLLGFFPTLLLSLRRKPLLPRWNLLFLMITIFLLTFQITGLIDIPSLAIRWLLFQGL
ncbi:MAG: cytochrome c biogenesis protein CcdA [Spirochaetales bacterium]